MGMGWYLSEVLFGSLAGFGDGGDHGHGARRGVHGRVPARWQASGVVSYPYILVGLGWVFTGVSVNVGASHVNPPPLGMISQEISLG